MKLDRKFLEGFSEVSAANGLTPLQTHSLLMKQAKFGTMAKILGGGALLGGTGLFLNKDKIHDTFREFGNSQFDYYNPNVYGTQTTAPTPPPVPHYANWTDDTGYRNNQWNPTPTTPNQVNTPQVPISKDIKAISLPKNVADTMKAEKEYQMLKQQLSGVNRQIESTNKMAEQYKQRLQSPNFIRQIPVVGDWFTNRDTAKLQEQADRLEALTKQQQTYRSVFDKVTPTRDQYWK